jgi:hypothetical protein
MDTTFTLRSSGNLTADETLTSVAVGPMNEPLWLNVLVPTVAGSDTLDVSLAFQNSSNATQATLAMKQITAAGLSRVPFFTNQPNLVVTLNVTDGAADGVNMGVVKVWVSTAGLYTA